MKYDPAENPSPRAGSRIVGRHKVDVVSAICGPDKWGSGEALELELLIVEGPSKGRRLWCSYYYEHQTSEGRVKYGRMMMRRVTEALGLGKWESDPVTGEVHEMRGKSCVVEVGENKVKPDKDEVKDWHALASFVAPVEARREPTEHDLARRNGQLAAVAAQAPAERADFDDEVPF